MLCALSFCPPTPLRGGVAYLPRPAELHRFCLLPRSKCQINIVVFFKSKRTRGHPALIMGCRKSETLRASPACCLGPPRELTCSRDPCQHAQLVGLPFTPRGNFPIVSISEKVGCCTSVKEKRIQGPLFVCKTPHPIFPACLIPKLGRNDKYAGDYSINQFGSG